ncbi:hypothetical protein E2C01_051639 [Portunus trituberculatus]|uniref:Uncharacterized protein n=1 Tax=Portunus trituberculatus TaxID=210409 RepID=A0A5B7GMB8_PORTR|nr:hypothetical protein [Portunus trituberculatus]
MSLVIGVPDEPSCLDHVISTVCLRKSLRRGRMSLSAAIGGWKCGFEGKEILTCWKVYGVAFKIQSDLPAGFSVSPADSEAEAWIFIICMHSSPSA